MKKPWNTDALVARFEARRNQELAVPMAVYTRNRFPFSGIQKPLHTVLMKEQPLEYLVPQKEQLKTIVQMLYRLPELIEPKSWWDSVDAIFPKIVGHIVLFDRKTTDPAMLEWTHGESLWSNRPAILHQLKFEQYTDIKMLNPTILPLAESREFFIQKSISWAVREYTKTEAAWVQDFVSVHSLKPLACGKH